MPEKNRKSEHLVDLKSYLKKDVWCVPLKSRRQIIAKSTLTRLINVLLEISVQNLLVAAEVLSEK